MSTLTITELKAKRDALDKRIANHQPLTHSAAVKKVRIYANEHDMAEDDLFPTPFDMTASPMPDREPMRNFRRPAFSNFCYEDTFGYIFIADLKEQRYELDKELRSIRREAVERARNFIGEYDLSKEDIFPAPYQAK